MVARGAYWLLGLLYHVRSCIRESDYHRDNSRGTGATGTGSSTALSPPPSSAASSSGVITP